MIRKIFIVASLALSAPAQAAVNYAFVASTGSDSLNVTCARTAPCLTINTALSNINPGGEVIIIGDGYQDYVVTVAKPATVRAEKKATITGGITISAGAGDRVTLQNLHIRNSTSAYASLTPGISIRSAADVLIEDCEVADTTYTTNFVGTEFGGIDINATSSVRVTLNRVTLFNNIVGVWVGGTPGTGHLKVFNSLLLGNRLAGVRVVGTGNDAFIAGAQILGSPKGVDLQSGGAAKSYGNNVITSGDAPSVAALN